MKYIQSEELREWVKENLRKTIFQKVSIHRLVGLFQLKFTPPLCNILVQSISEGVEIYAEVSRLIHLK